MEPIRVMNPTSKRVGFSGGGLVENLLTRLPLAAGAKGNLRTRLLGGRRRCGTKTQRHVIPGERLGHIRCPASITGGELLALEEQLKALQHFKGRKYSEAGAEELEWLERTRSAIVSAFGDPSSSLEHFCKARAAGRHNIVGIDKRQRQSNFELRVQHQDALLRSLLEQLGRHVDSTPPPSLRGEDGMKLH